MTRFRFAPLALSVALITSTASAALIDDFSGDLSAYTSTVILDANGGAANTAAWQIGGAGLEYDTSAYDGIEQTAYIYNGLALAVGEELQAVIDHSGGSQDLGLYVGGTTPVAGTRQDYVAVYARGNGQVFSRGFDGTGEYSLAGGGTPAYESLFIARTDTNTYEAGYYEAGVRNVLTTRTPSFANEGDVLGFYSDVRAAGVLGSVVSWSVVPEPASIAVLCVSGLALAGRRRRS